MRHLRLAFAVTTIIACNALTGAGDLTVCAGTECGSVDAGIVDVAVAKVDASPDAPTVTCTAAPRCEGLVRVACSGAVEARTPCDETCLDGACARWPSCRIDSPVCGATPGTSCCETKSVPGGTFRRANRDADPVTVSAFSLDRYEVTVGRFRAFVASGAGTRVSPPTPGSGAHPKVAQSGWKDVWNGYLPATTDALKTDMAGGTWTDEVGANEARPIASVSWFEAFAFCAWDGGRLPTFPEWSFAATGGDEQRVYPWSAPPTDSAIDATRASFDCAFASPPFTCPTPTCSDPAIPGACTAATCGVDGGTCSTPACFGCELAQDVAKVGIATAGAGRWGHFDLGGNVAEIVLDARSRRNGIDFVSPCTDCAQLMGDVPRTPGGSGGPSDDYEFFVLNGSWSDGQSAIANTRWERYKWSVRSAGIGFRCARDL